MELGLVAGNGGTSSEMGRISRRLRGERRTSTTKLPHCAKNTSEYWSFKPLSKYSTKGVERSIPPIETVRKATAVLEKVGITRVAEITGLDRVGIPNFISVRPRDLNPGISYYNGKGTTRADAHAGALMEAIERHAGECCDYPIVVGSYRELKKKLPCVLPSDIIVPAVMEYSDDLDLEWVCGYDLLQERETLVPLNSVICPYAPKERPILFYSSTNGLASGNTLIEAVCHALCEIIERDAQAISVARSELRPLVRAIAGAPLTQKESCTTRRRICLSTVPMRAQLLIAKLRRAGLDVYIQNLTSTAGIATFECSIVERKEDGGGEAYGGVGTHPDARVAILRSITEAAQSRLACIQGGREDLPEIIGHRTCLRVEEAFDRGNWISYQDVPSVEQERIDDDLRLLLDRLPQSGLHQVIAFDMTRPEVGIPVARVVVPSAETWPVFHLHTGRATLGPRIAKEL